MLVSLGKVLGELMILSNFSPWVMLGSGEAPTLF